MNRSIFYYFIFIILFYSCEDKVKEFSGFTQTELEYLLSSEEGKVWERVSKEEDGNDISLEDCDLENYLIFLSGNVGDEKPLLYSYNPAICDSLEFCDLHPDFCQADTMLCNANTEFCEQLRDEVLFIGTWYAKAPFINNDRSDTLVFTINDKKESIFVTGISSEHAVFQYKSRTGESGGLITEYFNFTP